MRVMSSPSPTNATESCSSEGSSSSSAATSSSSTNAAASDPSPMSGHTPSSSSAAASSEPPLAPRRHDGAPPPPPPPPPPSAPPPPPLPPPCGHALRRKRRVRSFFWKPIPEEKVRGKPNIWTMVVRQQQYQIDVRSVEELFGQQEETAAAAAGGGARAGGAGAGGGATGTSARVARSRSFKESSKDEISILDSKRGMNVGIFLKQFKKSNHSIVEDIRQGDGKLYGAELLKDLLKLLPESEEIKKLRAFKGDPSKLTLVDSFMYLLIQVPRFEVRIEAMVLREEFFTSCAVMSHDIDVIRVATKELMTCEELHAILHLVLQAGNIMNAGGYAGNAVGFKLSSLLSLADTKANKPGMNLLHFVALEAQKKDENLLKFPEKLQDVQSASRISVENIESEFSSLYVRTRTLEEKVQEDPGLLHQLEPFLQSSTRTLQELKRRRLDLRKEGNALIDFFCEDKDTFKLDECFRIFQDFCLKFKKAVKDNRERELKEAARQRRLRELEEKRFAWAGGDQSAGHFGRSSSENDVDALTKDGLLDFLQQRPHSPHSPPGRSASVRRHRHTMAAVADRELRGYLELFGGDGSADCSKFNSLPRAGRAPQRRTAAWLVSQDDNRELGPGRRIPATSPHAETEPVSPLARFSSAGFDAGEDPHAGKSDNNNYASVSEGSVLARNRNVFHAARVTGHINVSVEKRTLVPGLQPFDLPGPNNNNNSNHAHFVNQGDVLVTDLERETLPKTLALGGAPSCNRSLAGGPEPRAAWEDHMTPPASLQKEEEEEEEEESVSVSSTTCDTPLPLDTSASNRKPALYIMDCTEADCSVALDYSELESSSLLREGAVLDITTVDRSDNPARRPDGLRDPSSFSSSNFESTSTNDQSVSASTNEPSAPKPLDGRAAPVTESLAAEEGDTNSWDTGEKAVQTCGPKPAKAKGASKTGTGRGGVRTLTATETQCMRKVVPINRLTRAGSCASRSGHETGEPRRPLRDQSTPARGERAARAPRHSSLPPDESKVQKAGAAAPRRPSFRKPSAKPLRNIAKPPPEEKMCRSAMRALVQVQVQAGGPPAEASAPDTPTHGLQTPSALPGFARNTVAFSSRTKKEPAPASTPSTPSRSQQRQSATRAPSSTAPPPGAGGKHSPRGEERETPPQQGTVLRRVQSVRASGRSTRRSDTPPPAHERGRKSGSFSEKTVQCRDSAPSGRTPWK